MEGRLLVHHLAWPMAIAFLVGASQVSFAASDIATLTKGTTGSGGACSTGYWGFSSGVGGFGSYSPTALTGGNTVAHVFDYLSVFGCGSAAVLQVSGFSADPGSSWLTSITCNGVTRSQPTAIHSYGAGIAVWRWNANLFGFISLPNGTNVGCTIVHN